MEYAKAKDVSVEAEIGHVASNFDTNDTEALYTQPEEAKRFAEESGCDSLAISIGTAHGVYKAKAIPEISFDSLHAIQGISKVNIYTDLYLAAMDSVAKAEPKDYLSLLAAVKEGTQSCLKHYYEIFETKQV